MSRNQIFSASSAFKPKSPLKKVSIKRPSGPNSTSHVDLRSLQHPMLHNSKSRKSSFQTSSPHSNNFSKTFSIDSRSKSLVKQGTQSTESYSERQKDISILEHKLSLLSSKITTKNESNLINEIFDEVIRLTPALAGILATIKNRFSSFINHLEDQICEQKNAFSEYQENKQTLKILKKRFQKLAVENLDLNSRLTDKENDYIRVKYRIKEMVKVNEADKHSILELQEKNKKLTEEAETAKACLLQLRPQAKVFRQIMKYVKSNEPIENWKEKIINIMGAARKIKRHGHDIESSIEFEGDQNSLIFARTLSKAEVFSSDDEIESLIN